MKELEAVIIKLLDKRPIPVKEIVQQLAGAARRADPEDLAVLEWLSRLDGLMDENLAVPALALLPAWGLGGLDIVIDQAFNGPHRTSAFSVLGVIAQGRWLTPKDVPFLRKDQGTYFEYAVPEELSAEVLRRIRAAMLECIADPMAKSTLLWSIASLGIFPEDTDEYTSWFGFYMDLLIDSHLVVNRSMLQEFEALLDASPEKEEELQKFLTAQPVLLDPFVTELRSKHQLGDDFITDYVVRRINNEYVLVEIENSTDRIFTKEGHFTAAVTKALAQVRDFQAWVADNIAYAQKKLPGIRRPDGLVVVGRGKDLTELDLKRLSEENYSRRGYIKVVTYDDLIEQGRAVHQNLLNRPVILRAKDQRTI